MKILLIDNFFYRNGGSEVVFLNTGKLLEEHVEEGLISVKNGIKIFLKLF